MFAKSTIVLAFLAVAQLATATPPACFLSAINGQQTLSDYKTICGNSASDVQSTIQKVCTGDNTKAALSAFADACKAKGVTVPSPSSVASSASATGAKSTQSTGSSSAHSTGLVTSTTSGAKSTGTASSTGASATGAAGKMEASLMGGLLVVGAGVLAVL